MKEWLDGWRYPPDFEPLDPEQRYRYLQHRIELTQQLRQWGFSAPEDLVHEFDLAAIAWAVTYVQDEMGAGKRIRNPAGLFIWRLGKVSGRKPQV